MKLLNRLLPSYKLNEDIEIEYNKIDSIAPLNLSELSLISPIKKRVLLQRANKSKIKIEKSQKKLALIVPYRHREAHLKEFLPHTIEHLKKQNIEFKIVIVEQVDEKPFNKAKLMNIAAKSVADECDYFVFHDVDLLAKKIDYRYCNFTEKLFTYIEEDGEYKRYGDTIFGGAILVPKEVFFDINGFSNSYWQWGKEDDDFLLRHVLKGHIVLQDMQGELIALPHQPSIQRDTKGEYVSDATILEANKRMYKENKNVFSNLKRGISNQDKDGVATLENYKIVNIKKDEFTQRIEVLFLEGESSVR